MNVMRKRGRGNSLTRSEKQKIEELSEKGLKNTEIANEIGRDRKTVGKYLNTQGRALETRVRERVLEEALKQHFNELVAQVCKLKTRFEPCSSANIATFDLPMPNITLPANPPLALPVPGHPLMVFHAWWRMHGEFDSYSRLLIECLIDVHLKDASLWKHWANWNRIIDTYKRSGGELWQAITESIGSKGLQCEATFTPFFPKILMGQILLLADNQEDTITNELTIKKGGDDGSLVLKYRDTVIATAKDTTSLEEARSFFSDFRAEPRQEELLSKLKEGAQKIREEQDKLAELRDKIEDELEIIAMRKVFPGKCRLCPF